MSKRFGSARVPGCKCTIRFTCRACWVGRKPPIFTPTTVAEAQLARWTAWALRDDQPG